MLGATSKFEQVQNLSNRADVVLAEELSRFYDDPLGFVQFAFNWGEDDLIGFDGPDEWQIDILTDIGNAVKDRGFNGFEPVDPIKFATSSGHGIGKAQKTDTMTKRVIIDPHTKRAIDMQDIKWGDLKAGDYVFGKDGTPTKITGTRRCRKEFFRVTFDDGSSLDVAGEHEWNVRGRQERRNKLDTWRTMETQEIINTGVKRPNGRAMARQWEIPTCDPVQFEYQDVYDPYTVGVWLGDGTSKRGVISSSRLELWDKMNVTPVVVVEQEPRVTTMYRCNIEGLFTALKSYNMAPVTCDTKFIADIYKYNSEEVRRALVAGMLDTDGEVHKSGSIGYSSTSKQLTDDLIWMVRSLGGKAMIQPTVKKTSYVKNGVKSSACKPLYRCTINFGGLWNPFTHTCKKEKLSSKVEDRYTKRWIESIEPIGMKYGMCIEVEAEDHLYLANDFIVTHNSALTAWLIMWVMSTRPRSKGVVTANTADQLKTKTWAEVAKWHRRCITAHWFEVTATSIYHIKLSETWRGDCMTSREENSEAFAGLHCADSTPWYIFDEACHDDKTEVMTESGWKLFADVTQDDRLLTMNIDTGVAYHDHAVHMHVSHYNGDMMIREGKGSNFCVTPNHRMLYHSKKLPNTPQFAEAGEMVWSNKRISRTINILGSDVDSFTIPEYKSAQRTYPERTVSMDDWCELMGWYITEGHTTQQRDNTGGAPSATVITQKQEHYTDEIEACVKRMGFKYSRYDTGVWVYDVALTAYMMTLGKGFNGKRVPQYMKNLCIKQLNIFLDAAVKGDGYVKSENRHILYTSSEALAGDYQEMILKTNCNSTVMKRELEGRRTWIIDHWATSSCDGYVVSRTFNNSKMDCHKAKPERVHYEGMIYCATISGGVLFTRRNGVAMWSGNSAIPNSIWEVAEGGLTDGEPMMFVFGNPTRNNTKFFDCFHKNKHRWNARRVDSRTAKMTNKRLIQSWLEDYGEDSDFFRVRVKGEFPRAGEMQFMDSDLVTLAMSRSPGAYIPDEPLICSVDIARGGGDDTRIGFRRGKDAVSERCYRITAQDTRDSMKVVSKLSMVFDRHKPDIIFFDATGIGGPVADRLRQLGYNVVDVHFGAQADDKSKYKDKTAEMADRVRQWLLEGGALPDDNDLHKELTSREFTHNEKDQLVMERKKDLKKRLGFSPDWADQVYLTFAYHVPALDVPRGQVDATQWARDTHQSDYDPLGDM